jgi:hypothetical protein
MTDLETYVKTRLNEQLDAELGARRAAPPFRPPQRDRQRWTRPLLIAACVLAVAATALGIALSGGNGTHRQRPAHSKTPTPQSHRHPVQLGAAKIVLPGGWTAVPAARWHQTGESSVFGPDDWCLQPTSAPVRRTGICHLEFTAVDHTRNQFVPPWQRAVYGDPPQYCAPHAITSRDETQQSGVRTFGGRVAGWRQWRYACTATDTHIVEQYVVPTGPAFILFSDDATNARQAVFNTVAKYSTLPKQTSRLPIGDSGTVTAVQHVGNRLRITLRRTDTSTGSARTVTYTVTSKMYRHGYSPRIGDKVYVDTTGTTVTGVFKVS